MKTKLCLLVLIFTFGVTLTSCKKEQLTPENNNAGQSTMFRSIDEGIPLIPNPLPIENYFTNPDDADDERIIATLYNMANTSKNLFKDNILNRFIFEKAVLNDNNCADLRQILNSSNIRNLVDDKAAFDNLKQIVENADLTHRSQNPEGNGEIENYIPAIFVANIDNADINKLPVFSAGTYVNNNLLGAEQFQDYIVAWFWNGSNFVEFILNEEVAQRMTNPLFIFDNAEEEITNRAKQRNKFVQPEQPKNMNTAWYSSYEYQINHRYDNTNHSELCITGAHINENGQPQLICRKPNGTFDNWKKIAEVHKNNINQILYQWEQFCSNDVVPFNQNFIFWNTYERDWAKSPKDLGQASRNGITIYLNGRRQYSSEWYAYDPSVLNSNPVDLNTIYWNWAKWHDNSKSRFRIWRIQP